jgi:hypothetical protein
MRISNDKKGFIPIVMIVTIASVLLGAYILINIFPNFAVQKIKNFVNYISIITIFIAIQVFFIWGYYKIGILVKKGWGIYRNIILRWGTRIRRRLILQ